MLKKLQEKLLLLLVREGQIRSLTFRAAKYGLETGFFSFRFQAEEVSNQIVQLVVSEHILETGHV